jgi:hypothetical protein
MKFFQYYLKIANFVYEYKYVFDDTLRSKVPAQSTQSSNRCFLAYIQS